MAVLPQSESRYLRSPRLFAREDGLDLHVLASLPDREQHLVFRVGADLALDPAARIVAESEAWIAIDGEGVARASGAWDDRDEVGDARAWIERDGPRSRVWVQIGDRVTEIFDAVGIVAAPCVARVGDGAWIAFHHDVREDTGAPDVVKWIAVRFVNDAGDVFEIAEPMRDRDRDRTGEEQGFEFPSLAIGPGGAVMLYGRGSHAFFRQTADEAGWSAREPIGSGEWGCRGRRVAVCVFGDQVARAFRDKRGVIVEADAITRGAGPKLIPAKIRWAAPKLASDRRARSTSLDRDDLRTFFGDIHQHSAHSDGCGAADEPYLRARHRYGDDFCALSDHESFLGKRIGRGEWRTLVAAAERHNEPGVFATLLAYEWTGRKFPGPGHKVVYLSSKNDPIVSRDDIPEGKALVETLRGMGALCVPHHVGWTGADEGAHDPAIQPVWEICSCHGCYEHAAHVLGQRGDLRDQMVDAVLRRGHRFGFIASSDGHGLLWHHGVARKRDPFRTGLAAVRARTCTREAILDALRKRSCYATSGAKIALALRVDGAPMGSEIRASGPVRARAEAVGTSRVTRIELVGPDGVLETVAPNNEHGAIEIAVEGGFVYARVTQDDGEMAWSSPVWIDPS